MVIAGIFLLLNHRAYEGFFQDDELDNMKWGPSTPPIKFVTGLLSPLYQPDNFRPAGHLYFAVMGNRYGLHFAPWITPIFVLHLLNSVLLYLLMRRLSIPRWCAIAGAAFFALSAGAFDAYWKPMYVFDLLCATFSLASILFYASRRWVLSFVCFWLAYKSKELAVMLPAVLAVWEYWFGERKFLVLIPFALASLNFGIQGLVLNPNKDNDYTFRFTLHALRLTLPFYARRLFLFPFSGFLLLTAAFVRDRRVWFGLAAMAFLLVPLVFLPGRLFAAYTYLPLAFAAIVLAAFASNWNPVWGWIAIALWMPVNVREVRHERRAILDRDGLVQAFVGRLENWTRQNPAVNTLVYDGVPPGFNYYGVTAAWNILHGRMDLQALYATWPETPKVLAAEPVAYATWDTRAQRIEVRLHKP